MVEGGDRGRPEDAAHLSDGVILCDLEWARESLLSSTGVPQGSTICEGGDDNGVEYATPIAVGDPSYRVAEDSQGEYSGASTCGEGGNVVRPGESVIEEDAEVSDRM